MRVFGAILLLLIAALTGGCSLLFSPFALQDMVQGFSGGVGWLWLVSVGITALAVLQAIRLLRRRPPGPGQPPPRPDRQDGPPPGR